MISVVLTEQRLLVHVVYVQVQKQKLELELVHECCDWVGFYALLDGKIVKLFCTLNTTEMIKIG